MSEHTDTTQLTPLARISNEFAAVELDLDEVEANGARVRIRAVRDDVEVYLDAHSLALVAHVDHDVLALLADIARDGRARVEFAEWLAARRAQLVVPDELGLEPGEGDR